MKALARRHVADAKLHAVDLASGGLAELGKPAGYVARQVAGWTARYAAARTDDVPAMDTVAGWCGGLGLALVGAWLVGRWDDLAQPPP